MLKFLPVNNSQVARQHLVGFEQQPLQFLLNRQNGCSRNERLPLAVQNSLRDKSLQGATHQGTPLVWTYQLLAGDCVEKLEQVPVEINVTSLKTPIACRS